MSCDSKVQCWEEPHLCCWPSCKSADAREAERSAERSDLAQIVWTEGGGIADAWLRVRDRKPPDLNDPRPNHTDEKVAEAWRTADAILKRWKLTPLGDRAHG